MKRIARSNFKMWLQCHVTKKVAYQDRKSITYVFFQYFNENACFRIQISVPSEINFGCGALSFLFLQMTKSGFPTHFVVQWSIFIMHQILIHLQSVSGFCTIELSVNYRIICLNIEQDKHFLIILPCYLFVLILSKEL